jgi:aspartate/methionine/tyrosine aminotransferase
MKGNYFRLVFLPKPDQLEAAFDRIAGYMKQG